MSAWFDVREVAEDVHAILEPNHFEEVVSYLILGEEKAILLDTGMGVGNIGHLVGEITNKPITVVNSHHHWDHVGDNHRFNHIAIHAAEAHFLEHEPPEDTLREAMRADNLWGSLPPGFDPGDYHILPSTADQLLEDGDILNLGGRSLRVLHTPGHSQGSVCLLSEEEGLFFSGDTVYAGPLYIQLEDSDFSTYRESMKRLSDLASSLQSIMPAHNRTPLEPEILVKITAAFDQIAGGAASFTLMESQWGLLKHYEFTDFSVLLPSGA